MVRDVVAFFVGVSGVVYVAVANKGDRPDLLLACLGMMGLPTVLRRDEKSRSRREERRR